jgi:hypothetical protein
MRKLLLMLLALALATGSAMPSASADSECFSCKAYDCTPVEGEPYLYLCCEYQQIACGQCEVIPDSCQYISTE